MLDADVPADWIRVGREADVQVTVRNPGPSRTFEVGVTHDGESVATATLTVSAGTRTYEFGVVFTDARRGPVRVGAVTAGELTVAPDAEPTRTTGFGSDADGGVGPAALLGVALLAALLWRRSPDD